MAEQIVKTLIGRRDVANLPDFGLEGVAVKVDSGAYTSSIHVTICQEIEKNGEKKLEVVFLDGNHPAYTGKPIYFTTYRRKKVKSSTGHDQFRFFIKWSIEILDRKVNTEFSLTERRGMRYPILLGRKLLHKRFLIDSSLVNLSQLKSSL